MEDNEIIKHLSNEYPEFKVVEDICEIRDKELVEDIIFADIYLNDVLRGVVAISQEGQIKYQKITNLIDEIKLANELWDKIESQQKEKKKKNQSPKNKTQE